MISAGAAAAAAEERRKQIEEEEMTTYTPHDLSGEWEFKILRSSTGAFKKPQRLKEILEQERQAGWELVEKFDNSRIRLKRLASARNDDDTRSVDPYRSYVGPSEKQFGLIILAVVFGVIGTIAAVVVLVVKGR
jgi:hypothetical protein